MCTWIAFIGGAVSNFETVILFQCFSLYNNPSYHDKNHLLLIWTADTGTPSPARSMCVSTPSKCQHRNMLSSIQNAAFNVSSSTKIPFSTVPRCIHHNIHTTSSIVNFKSPFPFRLNPSRPFLHKITNAFNIPPSNNNNNYNNKPPEGINDAGQGQGLFASSPELEQLVMKSTDSPILLRVVSYNILSPSLSKSSHFTNCNPTNLDSTVRLKKVLNKLEAPVASRSIICLQEVSLSWSGHLHSFFANRGFHLILASHGSYFNGYMGEALAFPLDLFEAIDIKIEKLTDTIKWPEPAPKKSSTFFDRLSKAWNIIMNSSGQGEKRQKSFGDRMKEKKEPWNHAKGRLNRFIFVRLRSRTNGAKFCISTYHMPCIYWSPSVMLIHAGLVVRNFQRLCGSDDGILAGDFNIKPNDIAYNMITTGSIDKSHNDYPPNCPDGSSPDTFFPNPLAPLKSAYMEVLGSEPEFTNYAKLGNTDPFIECIDYLFCTGGVEVVDVLRLPNKDMIDGGGLPDNNEPSDHVMVGATVRVQAPIRSLRGGGGSFLYQTPYGQP